MERCTSLPLYGSIYNKTIINRYKIRVLYYRVWIKNFEISLRETSLLIAVFLIWYMKFCNMGWLYTYQSVEHVREKVIYMGVCAYTSYPSACIYVLSHFHAFSQNSFCVRGIILYDNILYEHVGKKTSNTDG